MGSSHSFILKIKLIAIGNFTAIEEKKVPLALAFPSASMLYLLHLDLPVQRLLASDS